MALNDITQVNLRMRLLGEDMLSVFFYRNLNDSVEAIDVALGFDALFLQSASSFVELAMALLNFTQVEAFNLFDPLDNASVVPTTPDGERNGDVLPKFNALPFLFPSTRRDIRSGGKRFPGLVSEGDIANGTYSPAAGPLANVTGLAADLATTLQDGDLVDFAQPVVVKRIGYDPDTGQPWTGPGAAPAYRLPESQAELEYYGVANVPIPANVSTQNSRKR